MKKLLKILFIIFAITALGTVLAISAFAEIYTGSCGSNVNYTLDTETGALEITGSGKMQNYYASSRAPWSSKNYFVKSAKISDSVTSIGDFCFSGCSSMTSITIGESVTSIGEYAFWNCTSLINIDIPNNVTSIDYFAFYGCEELKSITISNGVSYIGDYIFAQCYSLENIFVADDNKYFMDIDGVLFNKYGTTLIRCPSSKSGTMYIIPEGVTKIESAAFSFCGFENISIPESVSCIGSAAFDQTPFLSKLEHDEDGAIYIGAHLFDVKQDVSGDFEIKPGTKYIAESAFWCCNEITKVIIPDSVLQINRYSFYCSKLTDLVVHSKSAYFNNLAFDGCNSLRTIYLYEDSTAYNFFSASKYTKIFLNITVTFNSNGGAINEIEKTVIYDSAYGDLPTPILPGFTFEGWYTAISGGELITSETIVKIAEDHTLYAHWKGASYLVIFDACGGECDVDSKCVDFGSKFGELPTPERKGYKFITWSKTKSTSGAVSAETTYQSTSDTTLYAVWEKVNFGDTNSDGEINIKDIVLFAQYLAGWNVDVDSNLADCNSDGETDIKDVVLLAQYLAGWDITLG